MKIRKIVILGSSVALRVRPPAQPERLNKTYAQLLEDHLNESESDTIFNVNNLSFSRALVQEFLDKRDQISSANANYIVVNLGVVDAPSRDTPLWFSNILSKRYFSILYHPCSFIYDNFLKKRFRRTLTSIRFNRSWVSEKKFKANLTNLITLISRETYAKVIILGINKGSERIEKQLPGTLQKLKKYDKIMQSVALDFNLDFIPTSDLESEDLFPDGVHYNLKGHRHISNLIAPLILKNEKDLDHK